MFWRDSVVVEAGDWVLAMSSFEHNDRLVAGVAGWSATTVAGGSDVDADAADDGVIVSIARTVARLMQATQGPKHASNLTHVISRHKFQPYH